MSRTRDSHGTTRCYRGYPERSIYTQCENHQLSYVAWKETTGEHTDRGGSEGLTQLRQVLRPAASSGEHTRVGRLSQQTPEGEHRSRAVDVPGHTCRHLRSVKPGLCLEVPGATSGPQVNLKLQAGGCRHTQSWRLFCFFFFSPFLLAGCVSAGTLWTALAGG
jgi:hypothetical protein